MIAELLGASIPVGLVVAVAGAIGGLVLISLVFRFAMWVLGGLAGATIAIKVYAHVGMGQGSALVAVLLAAAVGLIVGSWPIATEPRRLADLGPSRLAGPAPGATEQG